MNALQKEYLEQRKIRSEINKQCKTAEGKIKIYEEMIDLIKFREYAGWVAGFCLTMPKRFKVYDSTDKRWNKLPELKACKPKKADLYGDGFWFHPKDYAIRINILESIIKKLKETLPTT